MCEDHSRAGAAGEGRTGAAPLPRVCVCVCVSGCACVSRQTNQSEATVQATSKLLQRMAAVVIARSVCSCVLVLPPSRLYELPCCCLCCFGRDSTLRKLEARLRSYVPAVSECVATLSGFANDAGAVRSTVSALAAEARHTHTVLQGYKRRALAELEEVRPHMHTHTHTHKLVVMNCRLDD